MLEPPLACRHCSLRRRACQLNEVASRPQQLKPKLATLRALPEDHSLKARLKEALVHHTPGVDFDASLTPDAMLTQLIEANSDMYDIIGQLSIALHEAMEVTPGYQPFTDHELHSDDAELREQRGAQVAPATAVERGGVDDDETARDDNSLRDSTGFEDGGGRVWSAGGGVHRGAELL